MFYLWLVLIFISCIDSVSCERVMAIHAFELGLIIRRLYIPTATLVTHQAFRDSSFCRSEAIIVV